MTKLEVSVRPADHQRVRNGVSKLNKHRLIREKADDVQTLEASLATVPTLPHLYARFGTLSSPRRRT